MHLEKGGGQEVGLGQTYKYKDNVVMSIRICVALPNLKVLRHRGEGEMDAQASTGNSFKTFLTYFV